MNQPIPSFYANNEGVAAAVIMAAEFLTELTPPQRLSEDTKESLRVMMPMLEVVVRGDFRRIRNRKVSHRLCGAVCMMYAVFEDVLKTGELTAAQWAMLQTARGPLNWFAEQMAQMDPPLYPEYAFAEERGRE